MSVIEQDILQLEKKIGFLSWVIGLGVILEGNTEIIVVYSSKKNITLHEKALVPTEFQGHPIKIKYIGKVMI